jgi:hypothetical protein
MFLHVRVHVSFGYSSLRGREGVLAMNLLRQYCAMHDAFVRLHTVSRSDQKQHSLKEFGLQQALTKTLLGDIQIRWYNAGHARECMPANFLGTGK